MSSNAVFDPRPDCGIALERQEFGQHQIKIKVLVDSCDVPKAGSGVRSHAHIRVVEEP